MEVFRVPPIIVHVVLTYACVVTSAKLQGSDAASDWRVNAPPGLRSTGQRDSQELSGLSSWRDPRPNQRASKVSACSCLCYWSPGMLFLGAPSTVQMVDFSAPVSSQDFLEAFLFLFISYRMFPVFSVLSAIPVVRPRSRSVR